MLKGIQLIVIPLLLPYLTQCQQSTVKLGVATVDGKQFCVGYRHGLWSPEEFEIERNSQFEMSQCQYVGEEQSSGSSCEVTTLEGENFLLVKAPFSLPFTDSFNQSSGYAATLQVRGDIHSALEANKTMILQPVHLRRIYWGSIIMYFFSLVYVTMSAVLVEAGRKLVQKHAPVTVLDNVKWIHTRPFLISFLVFFAIVIIVAFSGYIMKPESFQTLFAVFLFSLAIVGFYHAVFPVVVLLMMNCFAVSHRSYWLVERTVVIVAGIVLFGVWVWYRLTLSVWPIHLALMTCIGIVPLRYAPVDCLSKILVLGIISVLFSIVQRHVMPEVTGNAPTFVDIVSVKASIPASFSSGPIFPPDAIEPNMLHFRIPLFGAERPCSTVIDGSFGMMNFLLPSIFIKTAIQIDKRTTSKSIFTKNYTVAVVTYLLCHIAVFLWSFMENTPVNSNLIYLPGILFSLILNAWHMGYLRTAFYPPSPQQVSHDASTQQESQSDESPRTVVVYKVSPEQDCELSKL